MPKTQFEKMMAISIIAKSMKNGPAISQTTASPQLMESPSLRSTHQQTTAAKRPEIGQPVIPIQNATNSRMNQMSKGNPQANDATENIVIVESFQLLTTLIEQNITSFSTTRLLALACKCETILILAQSTNIEASPIRQNLKRSTEYGIDQGG